MIERDDPDESPYPGGVSSTMINPVSCKAATVSDTSVNSMVFHNAYEMLVVGSSYTAEAGADVSISAGIGIELVPEIRINEGATLELQVCGQSLCETYG